ncbi:MAG: PEP-CTERM sorting domain-containing protein [Acidobacteriia bacterium]|nr:PEP-CTERM sorting domain-containing protein [Terriglobia bacterium]
MTQNSDALTPFEMRVTMGVPEPATFFTLFGVMALLALVSFRRRQVQE